MHVAHVSVVHRFAGKEQAYRQSVAPIPPRAPKRPGFASAVAACDPGIVVPVGEDEPIRHALLHVVAEDCRKLRQCVIRHRARAFCS